MQNKPVQQGVHVQSGSRGYRAVQRACGITAFVLLLQFGLGSSSASGQSLSLYDEASEPQTGPVEVGTVEVELISEFKSLQPGQTQAIALRFEIAPHWHLYWHNPGDAGLPPKMNWNLPEGFVVSELRFPYPEKILLPPLASYGYEQTLLLLADLQVPESAQPGTTVRIEGKSKWLVCKEQCVPGQAAIAIDLPVTAEAPVHDMRWQNEIEATRFQFPIQLPGLSARAFVESKQITLDLKFPDGFAAPLDSILFFPLEEGVIEPFPSQLLSALDGGARLTLTRTLTDPAIPPSLSGIVYNPNGWRGAGSERAVWIEAEVKSEPPPSAAAGSGEVSTIWGALIFAFIGGLILNLMPCVLPVLSLKILSFVNQAGDQHGKILRHGLMFTLGVLVSFWTLAGLLLALKAGGEQIGWGFQLQSPVFLSLIAIFMFLFGLNLLGVFEIGESLTTVGGATVGKSGDGAAFMNGLIATVVATPCTAPFMGAAMGFTLAQPAAIALLVFTAVGIGMSSPYLLLSAFPQLLRFVPKPGRWMESLKQFMGFLLLATVVWLATVLVGVAGPLSIIWLMVAMLLSGMAAWVYGRWGSLMASSGSKLLATTVAIALVGLGAYLLMTKAAEVHATASEHADSSAMNASSLPWEQYSATKLAEYRNESRPVFVDFTADWCLSCKFNEGTALSTEKVRSTFQEQGIVAMKADWTRRDDEITQALASFGRNSVPLYVYYPAGNAQPRLLPELLTESIVLDAIGTQHVSQSQ